MTLVIAGLSNKQLSQRLRVGERTIKVHLHNIYEKLGLTSRRHLTLLAREQKELFDRDTRP